MCLERNLAKQRKREEAEGEELYIDIYTMYIMYGTYTMGIMYATPIAPSPYPNFMFQKSRIFIIILKAHIYIPIHKSLIVHKFIITLIN